jgi:hypothetical protein
VRSDADHAPERRQFVTVVGPATVQAAQSGCRRPAATAGRPVSRS